MMIFIIDESIDVHSFYDNSYDSWVEKTLGKEENSSAIAPIKLDSLYDSALDDDPNILDDPPCETMVTTICEDTNENDMLVVWNDTLTHESPISFLKSPIYTIEEKYALCKEYVHGLKSSYENSACSHDVNDYNYSCNYFERGKHANNCHDNFDEPLYAPKFTKLPQSSNYIANFAFNTCNYYERGSDKCPLYVLNNYKLQSPTVNMHWYTSICCALVIYKMPMHRKKVRLRCCCLYALCCSLLCSNMNITLIGLSTPWDPGIW